MPYMSDDCSIPEVSTTPDVNGGKQDILEPIAVIGFSLRMPQDAENPQALWQLLEEKRCTTTEWPKDRINIEAFHHPDPNRHDTIYPRGGHFLRGDLASFDASFFGISSNEAAAMDPQQRILLETSYRALENAGIPIEKTSGSKTGVYTGSMGDDYRALSARDLEDVPTYSATGSAASILANRLSWFFNFRGPSINMDSACSSSLMALDFACQGLRTGDCSMALVAGANALLTVDTCLSLTNMNFLSPDSRCYSFDERANGYARGEGFGVLIIKRLSDAIRDGDTLRAIIRSTGSNQDGHTPGITQPRKDAQAQLIQETYEKAGLDFGSTRFFEAHGTGTAIGDPIEAEAIASVFRKYRTSDDPLFIGALKSNIGHLEGASGVAGLIKSILVLEKGIIPPNANFEKLNPSIDAEFSNIEFPVDCTLWPAEGLRRVSVNSFGFGGSNSHAVLDDAFNFLRLRGLEANHCTTKEPTTHKHKHLIEPESDGQSTEKRHSSHLSKETSQKRQNSVPERSGLINGFASSENGLDRPSHYKILAWSAADEAGISRLINTYQDYFRGQPEKIGEDKSYIEDLAYTLGLRRSRLLWRSFAVVRSPDALLNIQDHSSKPHRSTDNSAVAFIFTGQGAQYRCMGMDLLSFPVYQNTLKAIDDIYQSFGTGWLLFDEISKDDHISKIHTPEISQPLCTALQIALVELLRSFGLMPSAVIGHSSGEIAASYAAGGLSLHSACKVSYFRGKLVQQFVNVTNSRGAMMSVNLSETGMHSYLQRGDLQHLLDQLTIACINSPDNVTISGSEGSIDALDLALQRDQIFSRKLNTGVAYHSPQMQEIACEYRSDLNDLSAAKNPSQRPLMISSVTGDRVSDIDVFCSAEYWVNNLVRPVKFSQALSCLLAQSRAPSRKKLGGTRQQVIHDLLEIGPHSTLKAPIEQILKTEASKGHIKYHYALSRHKQSMAALMDMAGQFYSLGYPISFQAINRTRNCLHDPCKVLVDLPEYSFNHNQKHWHESRLSKMIRFRENPRFELLGTSTPESNALEARWRKFFDIAETPWLDEHKVNGRAIYPAAGMIVMAIEGAKQLAQKNRTILGYRLKDTTFSNPIAISAIGSRTETQLYMRPIQRTYEKDSTSFQFRICILEESHWTENCQGTIHIQYEGTQSEVDAGREDSEKYEDTNRRYEEAVRTSIYPVEKESMYQVFKDIGLTYGPAFQGLQNLAYNGGDEAIGEIQTPQWGIASFQGPIQPHVIHPVTLDAAAQLMWVSLTEGATKPIATSVPTRLRNAWIASTGLGYPENTVLRGHTRSSFKGLRGTTSSMFAVDQTGGIKLSISDMETTNVSGQDQSQYQISNARNFCFSKCWKPDVSLMDPQQILAYCATREGGQPEPTDFFRDLGSLLSAYTFQTLKQVHWCEIDNSKPHLYRYYDWLNMQYTKLSDLGCSGVLDDIRSTEILADRLGTLNPQGKLYVTVGRNLLGILRGTADPLELLFHNGVAEAFYQDVFERSSCCRKIWGYLDSLAHKDPGMRLLEVGAGTGAMTSHILAPLLLHGENESGDARFGQYDYTDISESFFESARQKFATKAPRMRFRSLNIEHSPLEQGFEQESYDLVIASSVLHATQNLSVTLQNVRKLLRPGGKLILFEVTEFEELRTGFGFGVLPGWWMGAEENRKISPCVSSDEWNALLLRNKFSGVDFEIRDYQDDACHEMSLMVSTATEDVKDPEILPSTVLLYSKDSRMQSNIATRICTELKSAGQLDYELLDINDISLNRQFSSTTFVFLPEIDSSFLYNMDSAGWALLQEMVAKAYNLLWIRNFENTLDSSPKSEMIAGLARVLRSENSNRSLTTLAFETQHLSATDSARTAIKVLKIINSNVANDKETEYLEKDGVLMIPRVVEAQYLDNAVHGRISPQMKIQEFGKEPAMVMKIGTPGLLDSLHWTEDPNHSMDLAPDQIEIEVKAVGVNFRDLFVALGRHDGDTLGCECAGSVSRVGSNCKYLLKGDRVCAIIVGCMNTYARCDAQLAVKISDDMSFTEAAAIPLTGATAFNSLVEVARLQKGEAVLIHAAAGGTGQMAIQVAQSIGAVIYATIGSNEKKRLLMDVYNIPADNIFYSRDTTFAQGVMRMTQNRGVDVVLNSLSGDALTASWESIAPFGRFVEIGKSDIKANSSLSMSGFANNVTFSAVAIDYTCTHRPDLLRKSLVAVMKMVDKKTLKVASPLQVYPVSAFEESLRAVQSGRNMGKAVLEISPTDAVSTFLQPKVSCRFDPRSSYLIAGGLGGLGRSAAMWMAHQGAKNLILLSRSGGERSEAAANMLVELNDFGVRVATPKCDVASYESLRSALAQCSDMPPIRGCIQGTMVLRDSIFENMTFEDWTTTIRSKVHSSWNLHSILPRNLDFFIMLSSVAGVIGSVSQANYAAGNAYQGALARHRVTQGHKAIALDLGWMGSVGIIAETEKYRRNKEDVQDMALIEEHEFHALLDYYCDPSLELVTLMKAEPIVGLVTAAQFRSKGLQAPDWIQWPAFKRLAQLGLAESSPTLLDVSSGSTVDYLAELIRAPSNEQAGNVVVAALIQKLAKVLSSSSSEDIDVHKPLHAYGVDSLLAVELRNWMSREFQAEVAIFDIMGAESILKVGEIIVERSKARKE